MKAVAAARRGEPYIARLICRRARRQHGRSTGATVDLDGSLTRQACHHTVLEPGRPSEVWCCVPPHPLPHAATRLESLRSRTGVIVDRAILAEDKKHAPRSESPWLKKPMHGVSGSTAMASTPWSSMPPSSHSLAFTGFFRTEIFLAFSSASLESFCRERKGDFSCLTVAGICEASTSDAIGSGSWHSNAGSPCPISNSCAIYSSQWYGFQLGTARTQLLFKFFFPDVGWSPRNVGTCHSVRPGAQSQLVCSGCCNLLMYPAGATSICCAVCGTVTAVPAPEQKSSCNVHENKERLKGNTNGFRAPQRCARRVDGACTQVPNPLTLAMSLEKYTLKLLWSYLHCCV
uniref:Zinc finger LSD1-type domain-containing protein n=1 Tax=Oryza rufipogon TaxID=4529 RepID=A0A0E0Q816_ORYRU